MTRELEASRQDGGSHARAFEGSSSSKAKEFSVQWFLEMVDACRNVFILVEAYKKKIIICLCSHYI